MELLTLLWRMPAGFGRRGGAVLRYTAGAAVICVALALGLADAAQKESLENSVKAAYLSKFGLYVGWPNTAFSSPNSPLTLCTVGEDPFGEALDKAAADQRVDGRPIVVQRLKTVARDSGCHILYVDGSDPQRTRQIIDLVRGNGVLTVSDIRARDTGVMINFIIKDNRVRFDIDDEAAAQNGLTISSKLLSLALNVKRRPSEENR